MEGKIIVVTSGKGGVGKTTATSSIGAALALEGNRVAIVDMDIGLRNLDVVMGLENRIVFNIVDVVQERCKIEQAAIRDRRIDNLFLIPASQSDNKDVLTTAGVERVAKELRKQFDYVIMDCPPSLGILTINALTAVREVLIPLQPHFFALQGLSKLFETTALVNRRLNRDLRVTGVALCLYESGTRLAADVTEDLKYFLEESDSDAPWADAQIFRTKVRRNIKLAESPSFGQSIFDYAPRCPGAGTHREHGLRRTGSVHGGGLPGRRPGTVRRLR